MNIEIKINCPNPTEDLHLPYLTWGPSICHIRVRGNKGNKILYLRTRNLGMGRAVFTDAARKTVYPTATLTCTDETWTTFYLTGDFGNASTRDKDIEILIFQNDPSQDPNARPVATEALMVRVRKDVETLTEEEKMRYIRAFSLLNQKDGYAFYKQFTDMHIAKTDNEIHFFENFLPWHRLYLLNLERDLQDIDSSVSLHYWRWDFPAPNLFSEDFAGKMTITTAGIGSAPTFAITNPWRNWKPPGSAKLLRSAFNWDLTLNGGWDVLIRRNAPEAYAINMGKGIYLDLFWDQNRKRGEGAPGYVFSAPHGGGHMSFRGQISEIPTAPQDPVFFMLHSNVDRLWALWQNHWDRFDPEAANSYSPQGLSPNREEGFGAYSQQTQWPWNGDTQTPRPQQAPYGEYPTVKKGYKVLPKPTSQPNIEEVIDYKGRLTPSNSIGFDYDNIPFHFTAPPDLPLLKAMTEKQHIREILNKNLDSPLRLAALDSFDEPITGPDIDNLTRIILDKQEPAAVRSGVLQLLSSHLGHTEESIRILMNILTDLSEPVELRKTVMLQIRALSLEGSAFTKFRPIVIEGLRKLIRDKDQHIALEAIDLLAYQKDEWLQRELKEGLENTAKAIISAESAIYYLSLAPHDFLELFRNVAEKSSDKKAKIMAIQALSSDTNSTDFLLSLFENKTESSEVREASAQALDAQNPDLFLEKSVQVFKDDQEQDHHLLTVLLSKLTLQDEDGLNKIRGDEELLDKIRQHAKGPKLFKITSDNRKSIEVREDDFAILLKRLNSLL